MPSNVLSELFRRSLWLLPTLVLVTALAFAITSSALSSSQQPLFFNSNPQALAERAWHLAEEVGAASPQAAQASQTLVQLGGAALPHILPKLDSLPSEARARVAVALNPLAQRMGLSVQPLDGDRALSTWLSFWNDHFVDFHPAMVRRVVRRFVEHPNAQREREVRRLDTFALGELIAHLRPLGQALPGQQHNLRQVVKLLATVAGKDTTWQLADHTSPDQAQATIARWQLWWLQERNRFESSVGVERLLAPVLQTQYATWARSAAFTWFRSGPGGFIAQFPWRRFATSSALFLFALVGGGVLGPRLGSWFTLRAPAVLRRTQSVVALSWLGLPPAFVSACLALSGRFQFALALLVTLATGTAIAALYQSGHTRVTSQQALESPLVRRASSPAVWALCTHASSLLATVIVVEHAFGIEGLGPLAIAALKAGNIEVLLLTAVLTTTFVSLVPIAGLMLTREVAGSGEALAARQSDG